MSDDFDDQATPPHACAPIMIVEQPRDLSDSERDWYAKRFESKVPVVQPREAPRPYELIARTTTPDELELLRHFRLAGDPAALAEFVVKLFAEHRELRRDLNDKIEADSSDNQQALEELRALLSRPPNGRLQALQERVDTLERASEKADTAADGRLKTLEGDARFARRAAQAVIVFLILSVGAAGIWIGAREQRLDNVVDEVKDLKQRRTSP